MGRHDITQRKQVAVLLALAAGLSKHASAAKAGISYRQFARWQVEDDAFAEAVDAAIDQARASAEERVVAAGEKDWRAAAWWLDYLDGVRRPKGPADLSAAPAAPTSTELTPEQQAANLEHARAVFRVLHAAVGPERTVEVIANRLDERHRIG